MDGADFRAQFPNMIAFMALLPGWDDIDREAVWSIYGDLAEDAEQDSAQEFVRVLDDCGDAYDRMFQFYWDKYRRDSERRDECIAKLVAFE